jgi:ABC-type Mn2+/Zn2+ transport system permease subunit
MDYDSIQASDNHEDRIMTFIFGTALVKKKKKKIITLPIKTVILIINSLSVKKYLLITASVWWQ